MESTSRAKLIIIGLVLAAVIVGYLILAEKFGGAQVSNQSQKVTVASPKASGSPRIIVFPNGSASPSPLLLNQGTNPKPTATPKGLTTLPKTGVHDVLVGIFAASSMVAGWFLRKYPR